MLSFVFYSFIKPVSYLELFMTKKEPVQNVSLVTLSVTDGLVTTNNVSAAANVANDSFGDVLMSKNEMNPPGLNYGSTKAILLGDSLSFLAIAPSKSNKSKITGSTNSPSKILTSPAFHTYFTMVLTLEKLTALSLS